MKSKLNKFEHVKSVAGERMVSMLDCYVGGLLFKSYILPMLKHACG